MWEKIGPLVVWLIKREEFAIVNEHGKDITPCFYWWAV